jgi:hypothetical protein
VSIPLAIAAGLLLVIYFAEKLVAGVVGTAAGFGLSASTSKRAVRSPRLSRRPVNAAAGGRSA